MKIRFYNGMYLSPEGTAQEGEVHVSGGQISWVGDAGQRPDHFDREIDLRGGILLPGFKNAHTHSPMTFLRSYADDTNLQEWLNTQVFPREAKLSEGDIYAFTRVAILDYLSGGTTAAFDMYVGTSAVARAAADMGFRMVLCGTVNDFLQSAELIDEYYRQLNALHPLISFQLGFHAEYTTSLELLERIATLAEKYRAPVYTHICETKKETEACIRRWGKTPARLFHDLGLWRYGGGGFHSIYLTEEDMQLYREDGVYAITCPCSNLKLASGIAPLQKLTEYGVPIAIGTDGPASNNGLDMLREMYLAAVLQKYLTGDPAVCPADQVLKMAVSNGAAAMGLSGNGQIAPGCKADLTVVDFSRANMQPMHNPVKNLVYSGNPSNIRLTMIDGKILYEDGAFFVGVPVDEIYKEAQERAEKLVRE